MAASLVLAAAAMLAPWPAQAGDQCNAIAPFSDMIDGLPTLLGSFDLSAPHSLTAATWKEQGAFDDPVPVTVDLDSAFEKLKPTAP